MEKYSMLEQCTYKTCFTNDGDMCPGDYSTRPPPTHTHTHTPKPTHLAVLPATSVDLPIGPGQLAGLDALQLEHAQVGIGSQKDLAQSAGHRAVHRWTGPIMGPRSKQSKPASRQTTPPRCPDRWLRRKLACGVRQGIQVSRCALERQPTRDRGQHHEGVTGMTLSLWCPGGMHGRGILAVERLPTRRRSLLASNGSTNARLLLFESRRKCCLLAHAARAIVVGTPVFMKAPTGHVPSYADVHQQTDASAKK